MPNRISRASIIAIVALAFSLASIGTARGASRTYLVTGDRTALSAAHPDTGTLVFCHRNGHIVSGGFYGANENVTRKFAFPSVVPGDLTQDWVVFAGLKSHASSGWVQAWAKCAS